MKYSYPRLRDFLSEVNAPQEPANANKGVKRINAEDIPTIRIEDCEFVYSAAGKKIDMKKLKFEMESAKTAIIGQAPLFAPYVHEFIPIYTWLVPTMGTDGIRLFVNPVFADELSWTQKIFVLIHEIMHCVLLHQERGANYDPEDFNIAGDLEINPIIVDTFKSTSAQFTEKFVKDLDGLYEEKYLNWPVEQIYRDIAGKYKKKQPQQQQQQPKEIEIKVGMKVRVKSTNKIGIVKVVNPDGTYMVDELLDESQIFYPRLFINEKITGIHQPGSTIGKPEKYNRDQIIPIMQSGGGSGKGQSGPPPKGEYEIEGQQGQQGQQGESRENEKDDQNGALKNTLAGMDGTRTGSIIPKNVGEKIAKIEGYAPEDAKIGEDSGTKWANNGKKMLADMAGGGGEGAGAGRGHGGGLLKGVLGRLHNSQVDWKRVFKKYVGNALAPEEEDYIPNKKYIHDPNYPWRLGDREKYDAIGKIIVCVDVSGSMDQKTIQRIVDEMCGIIFSKKVTEIVVILFDDGVFEPVQIVKVGSKCQIKRPERAGGTCFQTAFDYIKQKYHDKVNLCVFFTDGGDCCATPRKPKFSKKVIWVVYDNYDWKAPWGSRLIKCAAGDM